ncbi:protein trichome birefringence-like 39 [Hibiscus syriacus]|uniref:protein trichome birefringence-like 39 n=1 Tax=Hibiscus syriacus TaxID=106335 RepID=UPI001922CB77|nr:protein trichome birefringence-like 39 [Hibiscus syriacus]
MEEGGKTWKDMNRMIAYYKGLTTWSRWVNRDVDPSRTKVFFQPIMRERSGTNQHNHVLDRLTRSSERDIQQQQARPWLGLV